jgi:hypothetical protein
VRERVPLRSLWRPEVLVAAGVVAFASVVLLAFDTPATAVGAFFAYIVLYTLLPGLAAWTIVSGRLPTELRELALGWALGWALELAAYVLCAALGVRELFVLQPVVVLAVAAAVWIVRARRETTVEAWGSAAEEDEGRGWVWALGVLLIVLIAYVAEDYFTGLPLPWTLTDSVTYYQDYVWQLSLAGELRHQWPPEVPNLVGEPLKSHWFTFAHVAAVNQVTGIQLVTIGFRLDVIPTVVLIVLLLVALGRELSGRAWVGVVGAALAFLVGPFDPWPRPPSEFFTHIYQGSTYGYGLIAFLALALVLVRQLRGPGLGRPAGWVLAAVFAAAASGGKASNLPVAFVALFLVGLFALWSERREAVRERLLTARVLIAGVLVGAVALLALLVLYPGTGGGLEVRPFEDVKGIFPAQLTDGAPLETLVVIVSLVPAYIKLLAPLLPGLWLVLRRREGDTVARVWPLSLLIAGLGLAAFLYQVGSSHWYFAYNGYVVAAVLSAAGLVSLWRRRFADVRPTATQAAVLTAVVLTAWVVDGPIGARAGEPTSARVWKWFDGEQTWSVANDNLTPELYDGYVWVRDNTPTSSVLATNNRWQDGPRIDPRYFYASAFAERRVVLEGEYGSPLAKFFAPGSVIDEAPASGAHPDRTSTLSAIFRGDPKAVQTAKERWGVTHIVLDQVHGAGTKPERVRRLGRVVFANVALLVIDVR